MKKENKILIGVILVLVTLSCLVIFNSYKKGYSEGIKDIGRHEKFVACNHGCTTMIKVEYRENYSLEIKKYNTHFFNCKKVCRLDYLIKDDEYWRDIEEVDMVELIKELDALESNEVKEK